MARDNPWLKKNPKSRRSIALLTQTLRDLTTFWTASVLPSTRALNPLDSLTPLRPLAKKRR